MSAEDARLIVVLTAIVIIGREITISALRELHAGYQATGVSTQQALKLENLVLAAPDLDEDVFMQRFVAENLAKAARRTTIYVSDRDMAIGRRAEKQETTCSGAEQLSAGGQITERPEYKLADVQLARGG